MNFDLVFLFIICLFIAYTLFDCQINESMADTSTSTTDTIKDAIKQVYLADVQAIRNLSNVATQLQTGGLTIPGKIIIGQSADAVSNSISDSVWDSNTLCIVGQGVGPNRKIRMWDNVTIDNNLSVKGSLNILPSGLVMAYTGSADPVGWLKCNGRAISRTTYASLFSVIGTSFGVGDGSTTFLIPNYQGSFLRGTGVSPSNPTNYVGPALNSVQLDSVQNHTHAINDPGHGHTFRPNGAGSNGLWNTNAQVVGDWGTAANKDNYVGSSKTNVTCGPLNTGNPALETRPLNYGVNWIIKI